jgi:threonine dehydratase
VTTAAAIESETGATFIHPYNNPDIIAGQGTVAVEMIDQIQNLDAIVVPVGGGGLLSGNCIAARGLQPSIRIFAAEPKGADDAARSFSAGTLIPQMTPNTIADGLLTSLGELTWPIIRDHIEQVVTVGEDEIVRAMWLVWERAKIVIEPSAAVAVAAVLSDEFKAVQECGRVGVVLSGGNVNLDNLPWSKRE